MRQEGIILGEQLQKARQVLELTLSEAAREVKVRAEQVADWESSASEPSLEQLESLADLYGREIDYFLRETPDPPRQIRFRGKPGESLKDLSRDAKLVLARFDELCRAAVEFEGLLNQSRDVRISPFVSGVEPRLGADHVRKQWGLKSEPITDLRGLLEDTGVRVFEIPVPNDELSGFSYWHEQYGPCILVDARDIKGRRNFTLAHELGHLLYRHGSCACYIPKLFGAGHERIESKANRFAVELLLPRKGVVEDSERRNLGKEPSEKQLRHMGSKWGVSVQALGYRLEGLGLIKAGLTRKMIESRPTHFRRPKVPTWERRLGRRFVGTSIAAYRKNLISVGKLAHALQIPIRKAMEIAEGRGP